MSARKINRIIILSILMIKSWIRCKRKKMYSWWPLITFEICTWMRWWIDWYLYIDTKNEFECRRLKVKLTDPPLGDARINSIPSLFPNFCRKILYVSANSLKCIPREWFEQTTSIRLGGSWRPVVIPTLSRNNLAVGGTVEVVWFDWILPPVVVIYKDKVGSIMNAISFKGFNYLLNDDIIHK